MNQQSRIMENDMNDRLNKRVTFQDGWVMIDDVKITKDELPDKDYPRLMSEMDYWNYYKYFHGVTYDEHTNQLEYIAPKTIVDLAMPFLDASYRILDVGAGTGLVGKLLKEKNKNFKIDALDFSNGMLRRAKQQRIYSEFIRGDVRQSTMLDLVTRYYHQVISSGLYGDFVKDISCIESLCQVLENNGVLAICGDYCYLRGISNRLQNIGFEIKVESENIGHYVIGGFPKQYKYVVAVLHSY